MTWREFLQALSDAGLTQKAFAAETGTDPAVVNRWQHRVRGVPRWVQLWLEARRPATKPKRGAKMAVRAG
jgi:hypothetical protein